MGKILEVKLEKTYKLTLSGEQLKLLYDYLKKQDQMFHNSGGYLRGTCLGSVFRTIQEELQYPDTRTWEV